MGIDFQGSTPTIVNNTVLYSVNIGIASFDNTAITANNIVAYCYLGIYNSYYSPGTTGAALSHNDFYGNQVDYEDDSGDTNHATDISADPLFVDKTNANYHLRFDSPCVDTGDPTNAPPTDLDGNVRPMDGNSDGITCVDIGCYENPGIAAGLLVSPSAGLQALGNIGGAFSPDSADYAVRNTSGQSIGWSATNTQNWLTLSSTGGVLGPYQSAMVTASINAGANPLLTGTYSDVITFVNTTTGLGNTTRAVTLTVGDIYVNVNAGWQAHDGRSWQTGYTTIEEGISAAVDGQVVRVAQGTYDTSGITIAKNITLRGGYAGQGDTRNVSAYATSIVYPWDTGYDNLISVESSCTIDGFTLSGGYFGISATKRCNMTILSNTITGSGYNAIDCGTATATIDGNIITGDTADPSYDGGNGIVALQAGTRITNNLIYNNSGDGIKISAGVEAINNTLVNNGWAGIDYSGAAIIRNNIMIGNQSGLYDEWSGYSWSDLECNDVTGNQLDYNSGNIYHPTDISADPLFVDPKNANYRLSLGSPCIDAGDPR